MELAQALRRAAQVRPAQTAIVEGDTRRTWLEVRERVAKAAGALRQRGLAPGDRAAVLALNCASYFETLYSVPWAGGVAVPINTRLAPAELDFILADSGARFLFVDRAFAPVVASLKSTAGLQAVVQFDEGYEALIASAPAVDAAPRGGADLAGIYYTGGTTGRPKGVMLSHDNLVANAANVVISLAYSEDTVYLHAPPMFHLADGCSTFGVTMLGGRHVFMQRFDPAAFLALVAAERVTDVTLVPTMINLLLNHPGFDASALKSMRRIYYGAAPMSDGLLQRAMSALPHVVFQQAWGMTELSPIATTLEAQYAVTEGPRAGKLRSCGRSVPLVEVRIVDSQDAEVPRGTVGEIAVRGPTVMQGYWNQPEATAQALRGGWMHSGDAAYMDEDGFVYIVDRLKDMIVTGGENVYSAEVESVISLMPQVSEVAVIGVPDELWGESVLAIVVPRAGAAIEAEAVISFCRERIAGYKCPRKVEIRDKPLPLSAAGKVMKSELRAPYWRGRDRNV